MLAQRSNWYTLFSCVSIGEYLYTLQRDERYPTDDNYRSFARNRMGVSESKRLAYPPEFGAIFGTGDFIYLFPQGINKTTYYVYNIQNDVWVTKQSATPFSMNYSMASGSLVPGNGNERSRFQPCVYDYKTGLLYLRSDDRGTTAFQFENSPLSAELEDNATVIVESFNDKPVIIQSDNNLAVGVSDVAVVDNGVLNGDIVVFYGNGEEWKLLKGKIRVTFSTGEETSYGSATYGQPIIEPTKPSKDGYEFVYWTLNGQEYDFSTPVTEPITLVAKWTEINPTFVDYIESTGTQYIDTEIPASITLKTVADITPLSKYYPFGVAPSSNTQYYGMVFSGTDGIVGSYLGSGIYPTFPNLWQIGNRCTITANDNKKFYYNDTLIADYTTTSNTLEFSNMSITICALNGAYLDSKMSMKIHSFQMYDGETLVRDFKPCKDSRGVYCLYDAVSNRYFYNAGTGEFEGDIPGVTQLNYIASTSYEVDTNYIDTGIYPTNNTKLELSINGKYNNYDMWYGSNKFGCQLNRGNPNYAHFSWGGNAYSHATTDLLNEKDYLIVQDKNVLYLNGSVLNTFAEATFESPYTLRLLAHPNGDRNGIAKIYYCKIWENDTLVRDYIPALDNSGVVCLYDKVSATYFYNQGTGSFTAG